jgi:rhamnosyltransferase
MRTSVVIRVRDEAASLAELLARLAAQGEPHEVVVVDSGSVDGSDTVARDAGARLLRIPAPAFTFGGALNDGTAAASGDVVVALSAHAFPRDEGWLGRMRDAFADERVACAYGPERGPRRLQDAATFDPRATYSNGAGAFRRALWEQHPFRADLPACEDVEWARWALASGDRVCLLDPALAVDHDHAHDPLRVCFERYRREARGYALLLDEPPYRARDALREWWADQGWHRSRTRARLDPRRAARLAGKWAGSRR